MYGEIEYLAKELKDTNLDWTPSKHLTWMLAVSIEEVVPEAMIVYRMRGHIKKAARLLFARHVTGRAITSFRQLEPGEIVRMKRWLEGNGPSPNDDKEDRDATRWLREDELKRWWIENSQKVMNLAHWLKVVKK